MTVKVLNSFLMIRSRQSVDLTNFVLTTALFQKAGRVFIAPHHSALFFPRCLHINGFCLLPFCYFLACTKQLKNKTLQGNRGQCCLCVLLLCYVHHPAWIYVRRQVGDGVGTGSTANLHSGIQCFSSPDAVRYFVFTRYQD